MGRYRKLIIPAGKPSKIPHRVWSGIQKVLVKVQRLKSGITNSVIEEWKVYRILYVKPP